MNRSRLIYGVQFGVLFAMILVVGLCAASRIADEIQQAFC